MKYKFYYLLLVGFFSVIFVIPANAEYHPSVPTINKYQSVYATVKINAYKKERNYFKKITTETGVILNAEGYVLTSLSGIAIEPGFEVLYQVCVNIPGIVDPDNEGKFTTPIVDCNYSAYKIDELEEYDLAVLKIKTLNGLSHVDQYGFTALGVSDRDELVKDDNIVIMGYDDTNFLEVDWRNSYIIEEENDNNQTWYEVKNLGVFKNRFVFAINYKGNISAILSPSSEYDFNKYLIGTEVIYEWLAGFIFPDFGTPKGVLSWYQDDFELFLRDKHIIENDVDIFTIEGINFSLEKRNYWNFIYEDENKLEINYVDDDDSGEMVISFYKLPYLMNLNNIDDILFGWYARQNKIVRLTDKKGLSLKNFDALFYNAVIDGQSKNMCYFIVNNYLFAIEYDYGEEDQDEEEILEILNSINYKDDYSFIYNTEYTNWKPGIFIGGLENWALESNDDFGRDVIFYNTDNYNSVVQIVVEDIVEEHRWFNNQEYIDFLTSRENGSIKSRSENRSKTVSFSTKLENDSINENLNNIVSIEYRVSNSGNTNYIKEFFVRKDAHVIRVLYKYYKKDKNKYIEGLNFSAKELLKTLVIEGVSLETEKEIVPVDNNVADKNDEIIDTSNNEKQNPISPVLPINLEIANRVSGKILLQVEEQGEAWYINPIDKKRSYLGKPKDAFDILRSFATGITNENLEKIPLGYMDLTGDDTDGDGLTDAFEIAIGLSEKNEDTNQDGIKDRQEVLSGYIVNNRISTSDTKLVERFKGRFLLQVEGNGEAWYVNPNDGKRYFLGRPHDAFNIMRKFGLGISNKDLFSISL